MYRRINHEEKEYFVPFDVICNNYGSRNVQVTAFEHYDLEIKCNRCGSYLSYGSYNPSSYNGGGNRY